MSIRIWVGRRCFNRSLYKTVYFLSGYNNIIIKLNIFIHMSIFIVKDTDTQVYIMFFITLIAKYVICPNNSFINIISKSVFTNNLISINLKPYWIYLHIVKFELRNLASSEDPFSLNESLALKLNYVFISLEHIVS